MMQKMRINRRIFGGKSAATSERIQTSILHMPVGIVNELPMQLLGLLRVELLAALWALKLTSHLDADVFNTAVSRLSRIGDFHRFRHVFWLWRGMGDKKRPKLPL